MNKIEQDRRAWPRIPLDRSCKVHDVNARKFVLAKAVNVSGGGALIEVMRYFSLQPGDPIELAVGRDDREMLLPGESMLEGEVVRTHRMPGDRTTVAVRFTMPCDRFQTDLALAA